MRPAFHLLDHCLERIVLGDRYRIASHDLCDLAPGDAWT